MSKNTKDKMEQILIRIKSVFILYWMTTIVIISLYIEDYAVSFPLLSRMRILPIETTQEYIRWSNLMLLSIPSSIIGGLIYIDQVLGGLIYLNHKVQKLYL